MAEEPDYRLRLIYHVPQVFLAVRRSLLRVIVVRWSFWTSTR